MGSIILLFSCYSNTVHSITHTPTPFYAGSGFMDIGLTNVYDHFCSSWVCKKVNRDDLWAVVAKKFHNLAND